MIRVERVTGLLLRLSAEHSDAAQPPYTAVCVLDESVEPPEIKGLCGLFHPRYVEELREKLTELGYKLVCASRVIGHRLPGAKRVGDKYHWEA